MKTGRLKPLVWPAVLLVVGVALGWLAEQAVGRWQDYQMYGIARPVADLTVLIGTVWLVVAVIRIVLAARRR